MPFWEIVRANHFNGVKTVRQDWRKENLRGDWEVKVQIDAQHYFFRTPTQPDRDLQQPFNMTHMKVTFNLPSRWWQTAACMQTIWQLCVLTHS